MNWRSLAFLVVTLGFCVPPASAQQQEQVYYYHLDAIGSVRMVTDANQQVVERHDYLPFGQEWQAPNPPSSERRLFTGTERDSETTFDYLGARYYTYGSGRFTTVDPQHVAGDVFNPQTWNAYAYTLNNPLRYVDPDGYASDCAHGTIDTGDGCMDSGDFRFWWDSFTQSWSSVIRDQRIQLEQLDHRVRTDPHFRCDSTEGCFASTPFIPAVGRLSGLVGRSFPGAGVVVANPGLAIRGFQGSVVPGHAINQIINRGVTPQLIKSIITNPTVVLEQWGGRYLYLTRQGAVVITQDGQVVTAWTMRDFFPHIWQVLKAVGSP